MQLMSSGLISLLSFVVAISVLVAIHEFGHYIVGRWAGMKVLRFSIGFGTPIWSRRAGKDDTEYCIASIPLGGYVRFLDTREGPIPPEDEGRAFNQRPIPHRIAVLAAGPLFNFLFAIVAYWALFMPGVMVLQPAIGDVETGSYADRAGLRYGDKILAVDGKQVNDWEATLVAILDSMVATGQVPLSLEDENGGQRRAVLDVGDDAARLTEPGVLFDGLGFDVWQPPAVIGSLTPGLPAEAAGLQVGDRITSIDGESVVSWNDLLAAVQPRPGETVEVEYVRNGYTASLDLTLGEETAGEERRGLIGFGHISFGSLHLAAPTASGIVDEEIQRIFRLERVPASNQAVLSSDCSSLAKNCETVLTDNKKNKRVARFEFGNRGLEVRTTAF